MEEDRTPIMRALGKCPVFAALNEVELRKLANLAAETEYEVGTSIFQEGTSAEALLVIKEGKVALQRSLANPVTKSPRRVTINIAGTNEAIGWSSLLEPHINNQTAVCLQRVKALSIDGAELRSLLSANHHIGYRVFSQLLKVVSSWLDDTGQALVSERLQNIENQKVG